MNKIIALWGVPRSVSSAFNQMMANRGDVSAYHEPFGEAYYYGEDRLSEREILDSNVRPGVTYQGIWDKIRKEAETRVVFFKDFLILIIIAVVIGVPATYLGMNNWLDSYASRIHFPWLMLGISILGILALAFVTVSFQTWKLASLNPAKTIRHE